MKHLIVILFLILAGTHTLALSISCDSKDTLSNIEELNKAFENAETVFLANVEIVYPAGTTAINWNYTLIEPVLKGTVSSSGVLLPGGSHCDRPAATEKGVFLVFWSKENDLLTSNNSKMVIYGGGKVVESWVLEWAKEKTYNKASNPTP
jgi:hypothetical protein